VISHPDAGPLAAWKASIAEVTAPVVPVVVGVDVGGVDVGVVVAGVFVVDVASCADDDPPEHAARTEPISRTLPPIIARPVHFEVL
jgi:hypothetical protein